MTTVSIGRAQDDARNCGMRSFACMMGAVVGLLCAVLLACPATAWADDPTGPFHVEGGQLGADYPARYNIADNGSGNSLVNAGVELGDFVVIGGKLGTDFTWFEGILTVKTSTPIEILMKDGVNQTTNRISISLNSDKELAHVTLAGVTIRQTSSYAAMRIAMGSVDLVLKDGTQNELASGENRAGLQKEEGVLGPLTISGGGKLTATGGSYGAGIGGGRNAKVSGIVIAGGEVVAEGGTNAAGIGGGRAGEVSSVVIAGGEIVATGGSGAAGIGGGSSAKANDITIDGGSVIATGGSRAAGIGGGDGGLGNGVTITGGDVTAKGGSVAAGIGSGYLIYDKTFANDIAIKGGVVKAESGGQGAACIGSGYSGAYASIAITGGALSLTKVGAGPYLGGSDGAYVDIKGGLFADSTPVIDNKVYGVAPDSGYKTMANEDPATKDAYPLTVVKAPEPSTLTLKPAGTSLVYDGAALEAADVVDTACYGSTPADMAADVAFTHKTASGAQQADLPKDAGTYTIEATLKAKDVGGKHYEQSKVEGQITIAKAPLTVTANSSAITYGQKPAGAGVSCSGFVNGETEAVLTGALDYDFTYSQYGNAGDYYLTPKGLTSNNYNISFESNRLIVNPAPAPQVTGASLDVKLGIAFDYTYTLDALLPVLEDACSYGTLAYSLADDSGMPAELYTPGTATIAQSELTLPILEAADVSVGPVELLVIQIESQNYRTFSNAIMVNAVEREVLSAAVSATPSTYEYDGRTLGDAVALSGEAKNAAGEVVAGTFAWSNPDVVPTPGDHRAAWTFTPEDAFNYQPLTGVVRVTVAPRVVDLAWSNTEGRFFGDGKQVEAVIKDGCILPGDEVGVTVGGGDARDAGEHTATATLTGAQASRYVLADDIARASYAIAQSGSEFKPGSVQVLDAQGNVVEGAASFSYGQKVKVTAKPTPTGEGAPTRVRTLNAANSAPASSGQMALFYGAVQVSEAVDADAEGVYTLEYDTASGRIPVGAAVTLTARYVASGNMAEASAVIELTVHPKVVGLEWSNIEGRVEGDGKQVMAKALGVLAGEDVAVTVEGADAATAGKHTATAVSLTGAHAVNYVLPDSASVSYEVAAKGPAGGGDVPSADETNSAGGAGGKAAKPLVSTGDGAAGAAFAMTAIAFAAVATAVAAVARCRRGRTQF